MAGNYLHMWLLLAIVFEAVAICSGGRLTAGCNVAIDDTARACTQVYRALESALISNEHNIFTLRKMFFSSPVASVALLKVKYAIDFSPYITDVPCSASRNNSDKIHPCVTREFVWANSGVYRIINPLILNLMQLQIPIFFLRKHRSINGFPDNPEVDAFLWDGSYELPFVSLHLTVDLKCLPTNGMLQNALEDLTVRVSHNNYNSSFLT